MLWLHCTELGGNLASHTLFQATQPLPTFAQLLPLPLLMLQLRSTYSVRVLPNRPLCRSYLCKPNDIHSPGASTVKRAAFLP